MCSLFRRYYKSEICPPLRRSVILRRGCSLYTDGIVVPLLQIWKIVFSKTDIIYAVKFANIYSRVNIFEAPFIYKDVRIKCRVKQFKRRKTLTQLQTEVKWFDILVLHCPGEVRVSVLRMCCRKLHVFVAQKLQADFQGQSTFLGAEAHIWFKIKCGRQRHRVVKCPIRHSMTKE